MPNVCELLKTIGHLGMSFSIPIYQRQYVWKEKEIHQLMDDFKTVRKWGISLF